MRFKLLLLFFALSGWVIAAHAQQTTIKGAIYKRISSERLSGVAVTNVKTNVFVLCDNQGGFAITAAPGDTLLFTKSGFTPQKQTASAYGMVVYMQPEMQLGEVRIVGQSKKQEMADIVKTYRSKGLYFDGKPPVTTFLPIGGSPLTGLYELFGKDAKNLRRFARYQKQELEATEVDKRYNKPFVIRVTGETDSTKVQQFMHFYRPSFEDLKQWGEYDLIKHTKEQWEYFKKNGGEDRLQKLY
ncbi:MULTISPECIES: hypothetical protein [unclassified Mucilaginibacter]|uniref:hypothetical protein n=1 Tax=unclassified Mucilaginibacter TaxID=2617802 RepID=UPI00095FF298|nr:MULTISPECIES: hypothetical protein [unclassified Mucilaginibacter]OJW16461.1 MAG: hypothetical protein BGO48_09810 [Mucilaginibacter sp. 44-25]PLW88252.1 MAG: hypothetical protein C0154_17535 [Mucilaginibacter sp.]HEK19067.1 hypothetical protein [Bacteroidota bacterium]